MYEKNNKKFLILLFKKITSLSIDIQEQGTVLFTNNINNIPESIDILTKEEIMNFIKNKPDGDTYNYIKIISK